MERIVQYGADMSVHISEIPMDRHLEPICSRQFNKLLCHLYTIDYSFTPQVKIKFSLYIGKKWTDQTHKKIYFLFANRNNSTPIWMCVERRPTHSVKKGIHISLMQSIWCTHLNVKNKVNSLWYRHAFCMRIMRWYCLFQFLKCSRFLQLFDQTFDGLLRPSTFNWRLLVPLFPSQ